MKKNKPNQKELYIVKFWRNTGQWSSGPVDHSPLIVFEAKDKEDATNIAKEYMRIYIKEKNFSGDFSISSIETFKEVVNKLKKALLLKNISKEPEKIAQIVTLGKTLDNFNYFYLHKSEFVDKYEMFSGSKLLDNL